MATFELFSVSSSPRYNAEERILAILTDDQEKKLDQYEQAPHSEMHGNLSGAKSGPQPPTL